MKKILAATLVILLASSSLLLAQGSVTSFYFGKKLDGDVLMVESMVRFDSRAPLGIIAGLIPGIKGKVDIWLDSVVLVTEKAGAEGEKRSAPSSGQISSARPPSGYQRPTVRFEIPLKNLFTGVTARDELLKSDKFLGVLGASSATFTLTGAEQLSSYQLRDGQEIGMTASGEVTLKGVSKRYGNIKVFLTYIKEKPLTEKTQQLTGDLLHISAEMSIKLSDFGISMPVENILTMDDAVKISVDAFGSTNP